MSDREPADRTPGEGTRAVHLPMLAPFAQRSFSVPVHRAASFAFESGQEFADVMADPALGYSYGRVDNPTSDAFAAAVAALEGARVPYEVSAQAFASGMAAITGALTPFLHAGARVVAPTSAYGTTTALLTGLFARFGVDVALVNIEDLPAVRAALSGAAVLLAETIANPTLVVADLPALAGIAHDAGALLVVDSTFASPAVCRPLEHGADLVVHAATKYLGGHSDATGGVVVGRPELTAQVRADRIMTGAMLAPDEAFLLRRGLETLPLRVERECASACALALAVRGHRAVQRVDYPGLPGHPSHEVATRLFDHGFAGTRYGGCVTITPYGGQQAGLALCDALALARVASSLGGTHTVVSHAATTTHRQLDAGGLAAAGIDAGAVRFSVGLEDAADVVADVLQALDSLPGR